MAALLSENTCLQPKPYFKTLFWLQKHLIAAKTAIFASNLAAMKDYPAIVGRKSRYKRLLLEKRFG